MAPPGRLVPWRPYYVQAENALVTQNQGDPVVERQLTVFDEYDLAPLGNHRRDHLVHRVVHDVWRGRVVDVQIQLSTLIDACRLVVSLFDHEDLPTAKPG